VKPSPPHSGAWSTIALCWLAALAEGFDGQSMGVAAPRMAPALHLARDQLGPAFSASVVGTLIGAIALGHIADRIGRKRTLIASLGIFGVFSFATAAAQGYAELLVIRLLAGVGLGGAAPIFVALASESVSAARGARMVAVVAGAIAFGAAVAGLVAAAGADWRTIFIAGGVAPLAIGAVIAVAMPESPPFLGIRAVARVEQTNIVSVYFGGRRALSTLLLWLGAFATLLTVFLLINWLPTLMAARGVTRSNASLVSMQFNVGAGLGAFAIAGLFGGHRRGPAYAIWFAGASLGVALLAITQADLVWAAAAGFVAGFFIGSIPLSFYALAPDFYEVDIRGTGVGGVIGAGRVGGIAGPILAGVLLGGGLHPRNVILALLPFMALGAVCTFLVLARRPGPRPVSDGPQVRVPAG
jgi:AAHS family 3-hydroxyphenylpropionic acid transporter